MRNCEERLKQCSEIPAIDRFLLAMKYNLSGLKLFIEKSLSSDELIKIVGELSDWKQKREVLDRRATVIWKDLKKKKKDILSEVKTEFLLQNITERLGNCYCGKEQKLELIYDDESGSVYNTSDYKTKWYH